MAGKVINHFPRLLTEMGIDREDGAALKKIADETKLSINTIKSWAFGVPSRFDRPVVELLSDYCGAPVLEVVVSNEQLG